VRRTSINEIEPSPGIGSEDRPVSRTADTWRVGSASAFLARGSVAYGQPWRPTRQEDPAVADDLMRLEFDLGPNEVSGLETFYNQRVLADHEWDVAFWAVLDEVAVDEAIGVIGHRYGERLDRGWVAERLHATTPDGVGKTEDAEAVGHHQGCIYIFGSHFGKKKGPLQRKRQFVGRFREGEVVEAFGGDPVELEIRRTGLHDGLHRVINDGLAERQVDLLAPGSNVRAAFYESDEDTPKDMRPAQGDHPINIEGVEFLDDGTAFLGLRWPVTAEGRPLVMAVAGIPAWFADGDLPTVTAVHVIDAVGDGGRLAGVRDLAIATGRLHVVTGNIDSRDKGKGSVLLEDHPDGANTVNTHFSCPLPAVNRDSLVPAEVVRAFPDMPRIEGIAVDFGHVFYASDENEGVDMRFTPFVVAERH
jgi:hypothetical protein